MRLVLLLCLVSASCASYAADPSDLHNEALHAIQSVLKKGDASLDWFHVLDKKAVDAEYSVMIVEAAPTEFRPGILKRVSVPRLTQIGIFIVSGKANQVRLVLDTYPASSAVTYPTLEQATAHSAYLHFYSDYGLYHGSIKYIYDLSSRRPPLKIRYGILALTSSTRQNGKLHYTASFGQAGQVQEGWSERHAIITIEPGAGDAAPSYRIVEPPYRIVDAPAPWDSAREPVPLLIGGGQSVLIENKTPPGQPHQSSGIDVISNSGSKHFYPVPVPTVVQHREALPGKQAPGEIDNEIGPFVLDGTRVWFANTFYDGEGLSGVGAVGTFDIPTRKYEMRYLPEIAPWSGSAILLDGEDLWIGLMGRPEGANYGTGLLRYNTRTGAVTKYAVPELIYTIDSVAGTLYCGTSHGLFTIRDKKVTQLRFEPDDKGKLIMVVREVR